ncbi:30S ribosomal protein S16 [Fulvivirga sp. RKSG066]|uniref:30S ribosomal protein S16 n=1 Tax=Fulvivirga aurantia TaxID=2529383 RepID=UPI0012BB99D0|nr:30S ribosomal protein S16 [Fulvivirga aurantia]MTI19768.1 30S ribosomal protein S16 [Fulvivirga aurantia]
MAVKIRLARRGRKKLALYDVVVADARSPRDGRFIERIGRYNPNTDPATVDLDEAKAFDWVMKGAQPTDTVRAMLSYRGIMLKKHLQIGVNKGAITQEEADKKFEAWLKEKDAKIEAKRDKLAKEAATTAKQRQDAETKVKEARAEALKKRAEEAAAEAKAAEEPEASEEPAEETATEEAPAAEAAEEPKAEAKEESADEEKKENK